MPRHWLLPAVARRPPNLVVAVRVVAVARLGAGHPMRISKPRGHPFMRSAPIRTCVSKLHGVVPPKSVQGLGVPRPATPGFNGAKRQAPRQISAGLSLLLGAPACKQLRLVAWKRGRAQKRAGGGDSHRAAQGLAPSQEKAPGDIPGRLKCGGTVRCGARAYRRGWGFLEGRGEGAASSGAAPRNARVARRKGGRLRQRQSGGGRCAGRGLREAEPRRVQQACARFWRGKATKAPGSARPSVRPPGPRRRPRNALSRGRRA
jgi:hypothetical protein